MPVNACVECGAPHWRFYKSAKGTCSERCRLIRARKMAKRWRERKEKKRRAALRKQMDLTITFTQAERDRYTYFLGQALACGVDDEGYEDEEYRQDALALVKKINGDPA